jgi:hypothetical protein
MSRDEALVRSLSCFVLIRSDQLGRIVLSCLSAKERKDGAKMVAGRVDTKPVEGWYLDDC